MWHSRSIQGPLWTRRLVWKVRWPWPDRGGGIWGLGPGGLVDGPLGHVRVGQLRAEAATPPRAPVAPEGSRRPAASLIRGRGRNPCFLPVSPECWGLSPLAPPNRVPPTAALSCQCRRPHARVMREEGQSPATPGGGVARGLSTAPPPAIMGTLPCRC